ncbi:MAG: ion transporter [Spirochaetales bacterium]|nr:ion transporter [Leptospiraceae bacterium]MCP5481724.1 ion transporter [Spirochaetales bacterium]
MKAKRKALDWLARLLSNPLLHLTSIALTLASLAVLVTPGLVDLGRDQEQWLAGLDLWILALFGLEALLRLIARDRRRYLRRPAFLIDLIVIAPLVLELAASYAEEHGWAGHETAAMLRDFPGLFLIKGMRGLRLIHSVQFFYNQKQLGVYGEGHISPIKTRLFTGLSFILFLIILAAGIGAARVQANLLETQRINRRQQIVTQSTLYGVLQAKLLFQSFIIGVYVTRDGQKLYLPGENFNPEDVRAYYRIGRDWEQIDEIQPGESVQISYRDLSRRQAYIELIILGIGILVILALLVSLNVYLERLVLGPVETALRVQELRLNGEELQYSEIAQEPYSEITRLINLSDLLYQRMRAPARTLLADDTSDSSRQELGPDETGA